MQQEPAVVTAAVEQQLTDGTLTFSLTVLDVHLDKPLCIKVSVFKGEVVMFSGEISQEDRDEGEVEIVRRG